MDLTETPKNTMWKDFFYFSKSQRIGIIFLLMILVAVIVANILLPRYFPDKLSLDKGFHDTVSVFLKSLQSRDSLRQVEWEKQTAERQKEYEEKYKHENTYPAFKQKEAATLFAFDPNQLDSAGFVKLGLQPYIASNILKYRKKGGKFRSPADFSKIYGIRSEKFTELAPYISIKSEEETSRQQAGTIKRGDIIVDINTADTTLLMQVKGIGRGYAKGIVRYRQLLGGYVSVDQLKELYGMRPENFEKIKPFCRVESIVLKKITVNTATTEKLDAHPYINFYQAKAIYQLRRKKGKLHSIDELSSLSEFSPTQIEKIKPYLSFE